jgi:hypothetical protein
MLEALPPPHPPDENDNAELVDAWTSAFLEEFERPASTKQRQSKPQVAFGRTTHPQHVEAERNTGQPIVRPRTSAQSAGREPRVSLFASTKLSAAREFEAQRQRETLLAPASDSQQSKFRGNQLRNFKFDLNKAREKRLRQLRYSKEIASGKRSRLSREIDSITRIVVQGFRKLIDCERCALFLMDDSRQELYFKPVGDGDHSHARLKEIRFPATSGVAGWVVSTKQPCNIKDAYHDSRFNADIDTMTGRNRHLFPFQCASSIAQPYCILSSFVRRINSRIPNKDYPLSSSTIVFKRASWSDTNGQQTERRC